MTSKVEKPKKDKEIDKVEKENKIENEDKKVDETVEKKKSDKKNIDDLSTKDLQNQGNIVADYIEGILDIANLEGDIEIEIKDKRVTVSVIADNVITKNALRKLAQKDSVQSLQNLSRLLVLNKTNAHSKIVIDVAGYRDKQKENIEKLATNMVNKAKETNKDVSMRPMNSFERRIVHQVVADSGLFSHSEGKGKDRHLIITLKEVEEQ